MTPALGLFGGTFDPIHWGHIRTAQALRSELSLQEIHFIVSARPPHRAAPHASAEQRLAMAELALADQSGLIADARELTRPGPSYTLWTLRALRAEHGSRSLLWVVGADTVPELSSWFHWTELLNFSHWVVLPRPGSRTQLPELLREYLVDDPGRLHDRAAGLIYIATTPEIQVSASEIRARLQRRQKVDMDIPEPVLKFIEQNGLYQDREQQRGLHAV
jgi:nicotinate-nucleotide adenylyltransferase